MLAQPHRDEFHRHLSAAIATLAEAPVTLKDDSNTLYRMARLLQEVQLLERRLHVAMGDKKRQP